MDLNGNLTNAIGIINHFVQVLAWIWLHLLVEDIANQRDKGSVIEDRLNKPWRPLPSGRLTSHEAQSWLRVATVLAVLWAAATESLLASLSLIVLVWMYNDLGGSGCGIFFRNALNAGGLMCFSWGSVLVLSKGKLLEQGSMWILITGAVILTTVHAQDLPGMEGDAARGRRTVALVYGEAATRMSLVVMVLIWSALCPWLWWGVASRDESWGTIRIVLLSLPVVTGGLIGALTLLSGKSSKPQILDKIVWKLWCAWITCLYLLPLVA